ncbi:altronate hydrolase [Desulfofundulus luciae]|uniref:Altronate hydrolase n=1 Tax=Desulfofundulus luciae TaxID=74702 RepID=A0ABU0B115_9FIRM|nr:altronate dehydratase family protein [Desulfofundulus luciae]MDQ0285967.1 altronate hydrolase [Desulfofundulus luciae]
MSVIRIKPDDNVAVALRDLAAGEIITLEDKSITIRQDIPAGHKLALAELNPGETVVKYGYPIGVATAKILPGDHVHAHNLKTSLEGTLSYSYQPLEIKPLPVPEEKDHFQGFVRSDGSVGIRNEIWIINTVGCVNKVAELLARKAREWIRMPGVEGIYHFPHPYGCSQLGEDHVNTQKILAGLARHPNAAGVLVLGLGCENNQINQFRGVLGEYDPRRILFLTAQEVEDEITTGLELLERLARYAAGFRRQPVPASRLKIGLKCGGSDAFSGITANPLVGMLSDILLAQGGTSILTEVPEMFGAETILMNRAINQDVFQRLVELINGFKAYFLNHGQVVYENPSPGNKAGGITTLEEKSLGCTQKGGQGAVVDVLRYGEQATRAGLNILEGPGNDLVATTALAAAGAHLVLFTTGRGTPLGCPVPTVKISSNSSLYTRKKNWIDFDAGCLLTGSTLPDLARELWQYILEVASGRKTRNEINNFREIAIFKQGVTL